MMKAYKKCFILSLIITSILSNCSKNKYIEFPEAELTDYSKYLLDFYLKEIQNDSDIVITMSIDKDSRDTTKKDIYVSIIQKEWQFCSDFIPDRIALYKGRKIYISGIVDTMFYHSTSRKIKLKKDVCDSSYIFLNYDPPMFYIVYDRNYVVKEIYNVTRENLLNYLKNYSKKPKLILTYRGVYNRFTQQNDDTTVTNMPHFPGGLDSLQKIIQKSLIYPQEARYNGIEGTVIVKFIVEKDGSISHVRVIRGVNALLDSAAIKAVKKLPNFIPAKKGGKPVKMWYVLPISFKLENKDK